MLLQPTIIFFRFSDEVTRMKSAKEADLAGPRFPLLFHTDLAPVVG